MSSALSLPSFCSVSFMYLRRAKSRLEEMYSRRRHMQYIAVRRSRARRQRDGGPSSSRNTYGPGSPAGSSEEGILAGSACRSLGSLEGCATSHLPQSFPARPSVSTTLPVGSGSITISPAYATTQGGSGVMASTIIASSSTGASTQTQSSLMSSSIGLVGVNTTGDPAAPWHSCMDGVRP